MGFQAGSGVWSPLKRGPPGPSASWGCEGIRVPPYMEMGRPWGDTSTAQGHGQGWLQGHAGSVTSTGGAPHLQESQHWQGTPGQSTEHSDSELEIPASFAIFLSLHPAEAAAHTGFSDKPTKPGQHCDLRVPSSLQHRTATVHTELH